MPEGAAEKYLIFKLEEELYGVHVKNIVQIIGLTEIRALPDSKNYFKGVVNLRGRIIPVIDMRLRFGMSQGAYNQRTSTIIIKDERGENYTGLIVDLVQEVLDLASEEIDVEFQSKVELDFIQGIAKNKGKIIILVNLESTIDDIDFISF